MARGRPSKRARATHNISGLKNQLRDPTDFSESTPQPIPCQSQAPSPNRDDLEEEDEDLSLLIHFDSLKTNLAYEEACRDDGEELENEELEEWEGFCDEGLAESMVELFKADDTFDSDWLPEKLKNKRNKRKKEKKERPKTYKKGPDVMSKSDRTQRRHARAMQGQSRLTAFSFKAPSYPTRVVRPKIPTKDSLMPIIDPEEQIRYQPEPKRLRVRSSSVLSDPSTDNEAAELV
ncbi:hypothetical protein JB92DRAFT_2930111, partial [Gautieria morchelliformis]